MTFAVSETRLASAVAQGGTFTVPYPPGTSRGDFIGGQGHQGFVGQALVRAPADFTVALNAASVTVTWNRAALAAGTRFVLQLNFPGSDEMEAKQYLGFLPGNGPAIQGATGLVPLLVRNVAPVDVVYVDIGNPVASSAVALRAAAALATTGNIALLAAGQTFDVPRNVIITSTGDATGTVFTVTGVDAYGQTVVENITGANAGVAAGVKAFARINSITNNVAVGAGNISIGFGNVFGLPFFVGAVGQILATVQDNAAPSNAPTNVAGLNPLTLSTATTADPRGTFAPNTNAGNVPDGTRTYGLFIMTTDPTFLGNPHFAG